MRLMRNRQGRPTAMPPQEYKRTINMTISLVVSFGLLVLVSVGAVLGLGLYSATTNTLNLIRDKADLSASLLEMTINEYLSPAAQQVAEVVRAIEGGTVDPMDARGFRKYLLGASAGQSHVSALAFVDTRYRLSGVQRQGKKLATTTLAVSNNQRLRAGLELTRRIGKAHWGQPILPKQFGETFLNLRQPVYRDGKFIGMVMALVSIRALSKELESLDQRASSVNFILQGKDHVVAHRDMDSHTDLMTARNPLPKLREYRDFILQVMWNEKNALENNIKMRPPLKTRLIRVGGEDFIFIWRDVPGFSAKPWIIGSYVSLKNVGQEVQRLRRSSIAGGVALLLAIVLAVVLGRRIARPVKRLSTAAERIGSLELDDVEELPGSRITELNQQAKAFNSMIGGLRWFEHYVPKPLVRHLLEQGEAETNALAMRDITVMFTDISDFSTFAEGKPPAEVATLLNEHFAILAECVKETGGNVDKFIGDGMMAFWGAPERLNDRAERACRAAILMAERIRAENAKRAMEGAPRIRIRVGIHSGEATIGNIGSPERINYTVVGDMVNVAARMEQLGKDLVANDRDITVLISEATRADLSTAFSPVSLGRHKVKGRGEAIEVFDLLPPKG